MGFSSLVRRYMGVGCASIIGSLMSFGFQHYDGDDFSSWQIMFLV